MRLLILAGALALAACSTSMSIGGDNGASASNAPVSDHSAWPFPQAPRGSALPPPSTAARQAAPPEGLAAGGVDFGQWRNADAAAYSSSFATQMSAREHGRDAAAVKADLEANGFACDSGSQLDCRIEIADNQCPRDWYVVLDGADIHAGYEKSCGVRGS
jgi:hypothetical protein